MAEYPLLILPEPTRAERARRFGGGGAIRKPGHDVQVRRLAPQFERLQRAMEQRQASLQDNPLGLQPEKVLVFETIGSISDFVNAVRRIDGLEWLGEFEQSDIPPEHGFADESNAEKPLRGQLFLAMTDQRALHELRRLFELWRSDPQTKFDYGLTKFRDAFVHLREIRHWGAEDRLRETGLLEDWRDRVGTSGDETVPFEIELWFRDSTMRRGQAETYLSHIIQSLDGEIIQQCLIPEIRYHALLGAIPRTSVQPLLDDTRSRDNIELFRCDEIMFLRPVGQCAVGTPDDLGDAEEVAEAVTDDTPTGAPIVALLDGLPLTQHALLADRLEVEDPDGFEGAYQAHQRRHGTAMASLICLGDLNEADAPIKRRLYVRPIMKPRTGFGGMFHEAIPQNELPIDLIHRSVRRMLEGENGEPPTAPEIRVINLSVCDLARPFDRSMSAWARALDWMAWNYNVLFLVSAGNHTQSIELDVSPTIFRHLGEQDIEETIVRSLARDNRNRRLLSPAESLNSLTIAATHDDATTNVPPNWIDPFSNGTFPNAINAQGPGYRRTIKPDLLLPGGRVVLSETLGNSNGNVTMDTFSYIGAPGQLIAAPAGSQGALDRKIHQRGTSNATALASRSAHLIYEVIEQLAQDLPRTLDREHEVLLLKALLAHGASWGSSYDRYLDILRNRQNGRVFRDYVARFFGYGAADVGRVLASTDQRATALGFGELVDGAADEFRLPLPPSLASKTDKRRLTITLAWFTPINSARQNYRVAQLWFNPKYQNQIAPNRLNADHTAVQRGTLQHEVLEGDAAIPFQDGDDLVIKVNCRADAGPIDEPIKYALAVTLEVAEGIDLPIYQEIRDRLAIRVRPGVLP